MAAAVVNRLGMRFGRLLVIAEAPRIGRDIAWSCRCDCGEQCVVRSRSLKGGTASCGCLQSEATTETFTTHGGSRTLLYGVWASMKDRCVNPNNPRFSYYGGKGIRVCAEWQDFVGFRAWAICAGYSEGLSIERKRSAGDYEPNNCEWIPLCENSRRMRAEQLAAA